jgi:putative membrane protein
MKKAGVLFTEEQKEKIRQAVIEAEARSSGEIVPMVIDQSGHYTQFPLTGSILFTFLVALVAAVFRPHISAAELLLVELATFWICFKIIERTDRLWAWLIPDSLMEKAVARRAEEAFYEQHLHETKEKTGVLIFLSLLEHRVHLLADTGIHTKVPAETWENLVQQITSGMKKGQPFEALHHAVGACGRLLAEHFPKNPDDTDELSNELRIEPFS